MGRRRYVGGDEMATATAVDPGATASSQPENGEALMQLGEQPAPTAAATAKVRTSFYLVFGYVRDEVVPGSRLAGMEVLMEGKSVRSCAKWMAQNGAFLRRIYSEMIVLRCRPITVLASDTAPRKRRQKANPEG